MVVRAPCYSRYRKKIMRGESRHSKLVYMQTGERIEVICMGLNLMVTMLKMLLAREVVDKRTGLEPATTVVQQENCLSKSDAEKVVNAALGGKGKSLKT